MYAQTTTHLALYVCASLLNGTAEQKDLATAACFGRKAFGVPCEHDIVYTADLDCSAPDPLCRCAEACLKSKFWPP